MAQRRLQPIHRAPLSRVEAVFTDVDGTLTSQGRLTGNTIKALEWLNAHGVRVVLVTGRSAGAADTWARTLPVDGVIAENGALFMRREGQRLRTTYLQPARTRAAHRARLSAVIGEATTRFAPAALSSDSAFTAVNLAIDIAEETALSESLVLRLERWLKTQGVTAVRSSVHINCWFGRFDKATAVKRYLADVWGTRLRSADPRYVYVGDSFNDQPLFRAFSLSVGVANVLDVASQLKYRPAFVTRSREGRGFGEVVDAIARQRRNRS